MTHKQLLFIVLSINLVIGILQFWGPRQQFDDAINWDSLPYGQFALYFEDRVEKECYIVGTDYAFKRMFPSVLVYYGIKFSGAEHSNQNVMTGFLLLNLITTLFAIYIWHLILIYFKWEMKSSIISYFCLLLINPIAVFQFVYPIMTDTMAYFLTVLLLYGYLTKKLCIILLSLIFSYFTSPLMPFLTLVPLAFPLKNTPIETSKLSKIFAYSIATLFGLFVSLIIVGYHFKRYNYTYEYGGIVQPVLALTPLTLFILFLYYLITLSGLLNNKNLYDFRNIWNQINLKNIVIALVIMALLSKLFIFLAFKNDPVVVRTQLRLLMMFIYHYYMHAIMKPFGGLVDHFLYYGPVLCFLIFYWKSFIQKIQNYGIGLVIFFVLGLFLWGKTEARHGMTWYPFIIFLLIPLLKIENWTTKQMWLFGIFAFIFSRIWWYPLGCNSAYNNSINKPYGLFPNLECFDNDITVALTHLGPWVSHRGHYFSIGIILIGMLFCWYFFVRQHPQKST